MISLSLSLWGNLSSLIIIGWTKLIKIYNYNYMYDCDNVNIIVMLPYSKVTLVLMSV